MATDQHGGVMKISVQILCVSTALLLFLPQTTTLQKDANHVRTVVYYIKEKYKKLLVFTKYRSKRKERYECEKGWFSNDDIACDYAICNGKTNLNGACRDFIADSHILFNGVLQSYPEGSCDDRESCTCTKKGFYSGGNVCKMCSAISHCDLETCTTSSNQVCQRCEGVVQETAGFRAYVASADRKTCNKACSWRPDSTRCYPGSCNNELASQCACSEGFSGAHCRTVTAKPQIVYNELKLQAAGGVEVIAPEDINAGPSGAQDKWTNIVDPASIFYKFEAQFLPSLPAYQPYVKEAKLGVIGGRVQMISKDGGGGTRGTSLTTTCTGASRSKPERNLFTCEGTILRSTLSASLPLPFPHGHRLDFSFHAENGGFVKIENKESGLIETHFYTGSSITHAYQLHFDTVPPYHCTDTAACVQSMVTLTEKAVSSSVSVTWKGWNDDDAGIDGYTYQVYGLHAVAGQLQHASIITDGASAGDATKATITVEQPGMYALVFNAIDRAGNSKSARRVFLIDHTSVITKLDRPTSPLRVTSAAEVTSWQWQQTEGEVRVTWTGRYTNSFHHSNHLLLAVAPEAGVSDDYDDNEGVRSVAGIDNDLGIVRFETAYGIDNKGGTTLSTPPDVAFKKEIGVTGSKTFQPKVTDGDTLTFWVHAYDLRDEYLEESVTVHVDSSPPVITNLWLTKGDLQNISVHGLEALNEMTIEWDAYDEHSGLKTVQWRMVDRFSGQDVVHGIATVTPQGNTQSLSQCQSKYASYPRGESCYCTGAVGCFHRHFQLKPAIVDSATNFHGGIFNTKNSATHDFDYHIEITAYNHANLSTTVSKQITVDLSPPHPGQVHDGMSGSPEVDYQPDRQLHANWWGFFDRESGVKFYQYAFHTRCLGAGVFGHDTNDARVIQTYETSASWDAPGDGKYYVTVVAFNSAIEASAPACSDGVTVDNTRPELSEVFVSGARIAGGVVSARREEREEVWFVDSERRRRLVDNPDQACFDAATSDVALTQFPQSPVTSAMPGPEACSVGALNRKFINSFYISTDHHLFLNWTGSDPESGIYDYEVGLASTTSEAEVADISEYTSTHHHSFYRNHHPTLAEESPFCILIRATNKAGLQAVKTLGPVLLVRSPASYTGTVTLNLTSDALLVAWDTALFHDVEPQYLRFSVALEEETSGAILQPHSQPLFSSSCASSPPSCATFDLAELHWGLHEKHAYVAKVKVTNIVGLDLHLTSDRYVHDTRLAARGRVFEVVPSGEEAILGIQRSEDTDYQLATTTLEARWSGFEDGSQEVSYRVGLGSSEGSDDVSEFVAVASSREHRFTGLSLQVNSKYYVTVVATTNAGDVTVSSDGVTVIQTDENEAKIRIKDGPACSAHGNQTWTPEHYGDILPVPCEDDTSFQTSLDTLRAHWTMTSTQRHRYPDVVYRIEKSAVGSGAWSDVTSYASSPRNDVIIAQGLSLQAGKHYRLAVKFCVSGACTLPIYSSGVYVIASPPITGSIAVEYYNSSGSSTLVVTMETFRDPAIPDLSTAQSAILGYQWSLSHRLKDNSQPMLTSWRNVNNMEAVNSTHSRFTIALPGELSFHKCPILTVRGTNRVGMVSLLTADVVDCEAEGPALVAPLVVLDAVGQTAQDSPSEGEPVTFGLNDAWTEDDRDYTTHSNIISAVWPKLRHSQVTWAVLESQGPDVTSHFLASARQPSDDPCSSPQQIACGNVTDQKYVNVVFGSGSSSLPAMQNGRHYYVCIHAIAETKHYEKWTEKLPDVRRCSDGVTVDLTSPEGGEVWVDGLLGGVYQTSVNVLSFRWSGFSDVEEVGLTVHLSGILSYQVAVGSVKGGEDVLPLSDVGLVNSYTLHSLAMQNGHVYYVTVRATDHVGRSVSVSSKGFVIDSTPPVKTAANFRFAQPYVTSETSISLCWTNMFIDEESGIGRYLVTVGSRPGHDDIMQGQEVTLDCQEFQTDVKMINGHVYYVTVGAINRAGLETVATSSAVVVMTTAPLSGHVFDGPPPGSGATPTDVDFVTSPDDVVAFWIGFSTPLVPVTSYSVRLGTCSGCDDVVADFDIGLSEVVTWSHAPLRHDIRYYTTVTACNALDQCSQVTSDGVMVDVMPPVAGPVWDGAEDEDIAYQSQRDFLGAQWRGFSDLGSGLRGFSWRAGTTPGGSDVMPERPLGLTFSAFTTDLPQLLPEGPTIFLTVSAMDAAGNKKEVTSNGFQVDTNPPVVVRVVELKPGAGTLDRAGLVSRDMMGVRWSFNDPTSHVASHHLSLHSHLYGEFQSSPVQVPGPLTEYTFTSLTLHDGSKYKVTVTSCNLARLCSTSVTGDLMHDSSPPSTGMFAVSTDHSAELGRHLDTWMVWTSTTLRLAWLGFHDDHSGIHSYHVSVGSTPFASDLNLDGTSTTVLHAGTTSTHSYEDEGYVQIYEVSTKPLASSQKVYVAIWAVNGIGLKSHPAMSEFELVEGGTLFLKRRCSSFNCLAHCACAVQGGICGGVKSCTEYTEADSPNALLTIKDHADLSVISNPSPLTPSDTHQASQSYLAATWTVSTSQGFQPIRYEVSAGRSNQRGPQGVFGVVGSRVWRDVGLETSSLIIIPSDVKLTPKIPYSTFVRAWYSDGSYAIFKSPGITPIVNRPSTTNLLGRAIKEHTSAGETKDVDFVTSSDYVYVSWAGKFISTSVPIKSFNVYIGTRPEASDIFASGPLSSSVDTYHVTGLKLREDTGYYSTVTAEGASGLVTWHVSDGILLDTQAPQAGLVMDGSGLKDVDWQSNDHVVSATWHGFYDAGSGVRRYWWCVSTASDTSLCDVKPWTDMGLMTSGTTHFVSAVNQGTTLYSKIYAEDAAGHRSQVIVSDGVRVDTTPPVISSMVYSDGINLIDNPSFENDPALNADLTQCNAQPPTSWELTKGSCVTLHRPQHTVSSEGVQHAVLSGTLQQTVTGVNPGGVYRLTLRLAHPHNALPNQKPVTGHVTVDTVTTPFELDPSLCRGVCDIGLEPVMLWHSFSYVATASSTTLHVSISTSVTSPDQQVAMDDVILVEIRDVASAGSKEEPSVRSSGVFLAEWSVVQTSWHFTDDVSPIVDYQWALGTSVGGVQLQGFGSVGRRQHASVSGLSLTHETSLYVTVLARNAAGMTSVAYSRPLVVDMTPPEILNLWDGDTGEDVDYQTAGIVSARWSVRDSQSSVDSCQWAIGTTPGKGDLHPFQKAVAVNRDTYNVSIDVTSALSALPLPTTLYVSVRCYNMAGLPARAVSDGVTISDGDAGQQMELLRVLPDSLTQYPVQESCHVHLDRLRLRWGNYVSQIPLAGFEIVRESAAGFNASRTPSLPYLLQAADVNLTSTSVLTAASRYRVTVHPVDILGTVGTGASHVTEVLPAQPAVTANERITSFLSGSDLTLSWPDLFTSALDLSYEVTAGSVEGAGDIMLWRKTPATNVVVSLVHSRKQTFSIYVVVTAIDPCGQYVTHTQTLNVALNP